MRKLSACTRIKRHLIKEGVSALLLDYHGPLDTEEEIDHVYREFLESDMLNCDVAVFTWPEDIIEEFRCSGLQTDVKQVYMSFGNNCDCKQVAKVLSDGTAVGWTYCLKEVKSEDLCASEWMDYAYDLDYEEMFAKTYVFFPTKGDV